MHDVANSFIICFFRSFRCPVLDFLPLFSVEICFCGSYVPTHLHLMVFELVKNSLRAVQEQYMDSDKVAPPVRIIVADGLEDVTIKAGSITLRD